MHELMGIVDLSLTASEIANLHRRQMSHLLAEYADGVCQSVGIPGLSVFLVDNGVSTEDPQPVRSPDNRFILIFDGEIANKNELCRQYLGDTAAAEMTSSKVFLSLYIKYGKEAFAKINGLFAVVIFDTQERYLTIATDRFGFRSVYYRRVADRLYFGSKLKSLIECDSQNRIDELGVVELFTYGQHIADRTWLDGCYRLGPGTIINFDGKTLARKRYWLYRYSKQRKQTDQRTLYTSFRYLVDRAVERAMEGPGRVGIFLSGGYDSRVIAASIREYHLPIPSFTFGDADSRDATFARMLAKSLRFDHTELRPEGPYLTDWCREIVARTEGMLPFSSTTSPQFHEILKRSMDTILVGLLGEFCGSHTWPQLLLSRTRVGARETIFSRATAANSQRVRRIFQPSVLQSTFGLMRDAFDASFDDVQNSHPLNIADGWNFMNVQPRGTFQAAAVDRDNFEVRAPLMDAELVDFLLTIPPYARLEQRVYKKLIAYGYPQIRAIPCTNSKRPVNPNFLYEFVVMASRKIARQIASPVLRHTGRRRSDNREPYDLASAMRREPALISHILNPLLEKEVYPTKIFNYEGINTLVHDMYVRKSDHAHFIALLISWGVAAESIV